MDSVSSISASELSFMEILQSSIKLLMAQRAPDFGLPEDLIFLC